jgi:hypothetical protein
MTVQHSRFRKNSVAAIILIVRSFGGVWARLVSSVRDSQRVAATLAVVYKTAIRITTERLSFRAIASESFALHSQQDTPTAGLIASGAASLRACSWREECARQRLISALPATIFVAVRACYVRVLFVRRVKSTQRSVIPKRAVFSESRDLSSCAAFAPPYRTWSRESATQSPKESPHESPRASGASRRNSLGARRGISLQLFRSLRFSCTTRRPCMTCLSCALSLRTLFINDVKCLTKPRRAL